MGDTRRGIHDYIGSWASMPNDPKKHNFSDGDSTVCAGVFDGEPRVMCEGGRTVGLNELVQMAAKVLTQAQAQVSAARNHLRFYLLP